MDKPVKTGSEQDAQPKGQLEGRLLHALAWLWLVPTLLLFYPLSMGPAIKLYPALYRACPATGVAFEAVYRPLYRLSSRYPPFGNAMGWYLEDVWHIR